MEPYFEDPLTLLSHFIGEYSQNVCGASYNEDQVREIWRKGMLNEDAKHPCYTLDSAWPDAPEDFQAEMNRLAKEAGAWPTGWCNQPLPFTNEERKLLGVGDTHGDVLCRLLQDLPKHDYAYHEQQFTLMFYRIYDSHQGKGTDIEAIAQEVWAEFWKQQREDARESQQAQTPRDYPEFSWGLQYHLRTMSVTFEQPSSEAKSFFDQWMLYAVEPEPGSKSH